MCWNRREKLDCQISKRHCRDAAAEDIISADQHERLSRFLEKRGFLAGAEEAAEPGDGLLRDLANPIADEPLNAVETSEAPRLIRGFHDILITIGTVAAVGGVWGLLGVWPAIAVIWGLAEILVRRQHLALPAFALTVLYVIAVVSGFAPLIAAQGEEHGNVVAGTVLFFVLPLALLPFYWRFRIPVALAALILTVVGWAMFLVLAIIGAASGAGDMSETMPLATALVGLAFSLLVFAIAMHFDVRDPTRRTRRSDVAFWLHLGAAPALLYTAFAVFLYNSDLGVWWSGDAGPLEAGIALAIIAVLMLVGIVIDRRAFVTSGLVSLGAAIVVLARQADLDMSEFAALPLLLVGLIVLTLGTGWQFLRRIIVRHLPDTVRLKVPPVRA